MAVVDIVKERTRDMYSWTNGLRHMSMVHLNGRMEPDVSAKVARVYDKRARVGDYYFLSGAIRLNERTGEWIRHEGGQDNDGINSPSTAYVNVIDKIKVYRSSMTVRNTSRQCGMCGMEGVRDKHKQTNSDLFLHEVSKSARPTGTKASYKRVDTSRATNLHNWSQEYNVSTINANMPKGFYDHVVRVRTDIAHQSSLNPVHTRLHPCLHRDGENNNSITNDSFISAVINSKTMKTKTLASTNTGGAFKLTHKDNFRTHKTVELYPSDELGTDLSRSYHKIKITPNIYDRLIPHDSYEVDDGHDDSDDDDNTPGDDLMEGGDKRAKQHCRQARLWSRALKPLTGTEIQIHERCFNCSAVPGWTMLPILCRKGAQMFSASNGNNVQISLAVNNCKAVLERICHSLVWRHLNQFAELLCWELGTQDLDYEAEHRTFHARCLPILQRIVGTRENYAQSDIFCHQSVRGTRLFTEPSYRLVSRKFKMSETATLFARSKKRSRSSSSGTSVSESGDAHGEGDPPCSKYQRKANCTLSAQPSRNDSITALYEHSSAMYRSRFDLSVPRLDQL